MESLNIRNITLTGNVDPYKLPECGWGLEPKLTLGNIQGVGTCLLPAGYPIQSSPYRNNCNHSSVIRITEGTTSLLAAPNGTWWACTSGLTPCAYTPTIASSEEDDHICILTHIIPQVYYYSEEGGRANFGLDRQKRVPVLIPVLMGLGMAGSMAVGAAALIKGNQDFKVLSNQVNTDLSALEASVTHLEGSLSSLAEVVLQNRRGLDLLFLKEGGLCMALGETCCFWTNHSGVIRENTSQLRKRLKDREEARRDGTNWYEGLFNWSPWLTTLVSALAGPLVLLLLALTFGACLLRSISRLIASKIQDLKIMVLRTHYQPILPEGGEPESRV